MRFISLAFVFVNIMLIPPAITKSKGLSPSIFLSQTHNIRPNDTFFFKHLSSRPDDNSKSMEQEKVIERIKDIAERILPAGASLWLYGSRARGEAQPDSDYDLLILLDKDHITSEDHDNFGYPLRMSGWEIWTEINPHIYTRKDWQSWSFSPFYKNVEQDKIVLK